MKTTALLTAAALLGSATAKVHKLKLEKIPVSERFVCNSLDVVWIEKWL